MTVTRRHPSAKPGGRLSRRGLVTKQKMSALARQDHASDSVWAEMNRKMDEVYAELARSDDELRDAYKALSEAHEKLKQTQQQLVQSEKLASLGRLVAGVAHELNNPISFMLGNVQVLGRYIARLKNYLDGVHRGLPPVERDQLRRELKIDKLVADLELLLAGTVEGAERTRGIIDGLKRFSTADRHEEAVFDLAEVVQRAGQWVARASGSRLRVEFVLPEALPVKGSAGQLHQVVVNLVQNAADATEGMIDPRLIVHGGIEAGHAVIRFHDNGRGIEAGHLSRVFDPFFTTKPVGKGTGLGLSISYGIVERHRGSLKAANDPEGGAVFTLSLPLAGAEK